MVLFLRTESFILPFLVMTHAFAGGTARRAFIWLLMGLWLLAATLPAPVSAQTAEATPDPFADFDPFSPPSEEVQVAVPEQLALQQVTVAGLNAVVGASNVVTGAFTITNQTAAAVGDIAYDIVLLGPLPELVPDELVPDTAPVYDVQRFTDEVFAVAAGATRTVNYTYTAPAVPQGEYRVRVQLRHSNGRELNFGDTTVALGGAETFIVNQPQLVTVASQDPILGIEGTEWAPLQGPNVDPGGGGNTDD